MRKILARTGIFGRFVLFAGVAAGAAILCAPPARAQFVGYTSPQTVTASVTSAPCTTSAAILNIPNIGQSFHYVNYVIVTGAPVQVAVTIQGSYDGLTFFIISDQATDQLSTGAQVVGYGYFPVMRVVGTCTGGTNATMTINYSGTSVSSSLQFSDLDRTIFRKPVFIQAPQGSVNNSQTIRPPYGNSGGMLACQALTSGFPANSTVSIVNLADNAISSFTLSGPYTLQSTTQPQFFPIASVPTSAIQINYANGGASANTFNCEILFFRAGAVNPGAQPGQPSVTRNSESTSALNAAVTVSLTAFPAQRVHLYSVSARCSAGTAQLTVKDGVAGTTIWTTAATEVGATTFRFQWNPPLSSSANNGMDITLSACGAGNTGTLDVQASQF